MTTPTSGGPIGGHIPGLIGSYQPPRQSTAKVRAKAAAVKPKPTAKKTPKPSTKRGK